MFTLCQGDGGWTVSCLKDFIFIGEYPLHLLPNLRIIINEQERRPKQARFGFHVDFCTSGQFPALFFLYL